MTSGPPDRRRSSDSTSLADLLRSSRRALHDAGIDSADQEAVWLLSAALSLTPLDIRVHADRHVDDDAVARAQVLVTRRVAREPLQYILGTQEFCGREFSVTPAVLIPRPETELLVRIAREAIADRANPVLMDVGTGSGCLAVTLACMLPTARIFAIDYSPAALDVAQRNAARYGVRERIEWIHSDLLSACAERCHDRDVSVLVANPPYIPDAELDRLQPEVARHEPRLALAGGPDGLSIFRRLIAEAPRYLADGATIAIEIGQGQAEAAAEALAAVSAYESIHVVRDDAGIDRVMVARRRPASSR
ncbi:MAG: peptide chain release factor N(5)-glutamine methyltransferase [Nitrospiraceae bacterium]